MSTSYKVYWELGYLGLSMRDITELMGKAYQASTGIHQMGAKGMIPIPGSNRVLVYDSGIDGWDAVYYIEDNVDALKEQCDNKDCCCEK